MLAAALIVFRAVFEAGLILGIVLGATRGVPGRGRWVAGGIGAGVAGACVVAAFAGVLADAARVYSDNDVRTGISAFHTGFGGGIYVDILKQAVINATFSVGEEKLVFIGFDFLF